MDELPASLIVLVLLVVTLNETVAALQCYACPPTEDYNNCSTPQNIERCQIGDDNCFTQTLYTGGSQYKVKMVTKSCVTSTFCQEEKSLYNPDICIAKNSDYVCVACCKGDRCNVGDDVAMVTANASTILFLLTVNLYATHVGIWSLFLKNTIRTAMGTVVRVFYFMTYVTARFLVKSTIKNHLIMVAFGGVFAWLCYDHRILATVVRCPWLQDETVTFERRIYWN